MPRETTKQKIDKVLGIADNVSIDDYLDNLSFDDEINTIPNVFDGIDENIKTNIQNIDNKLQTDDKENLSLTTINDIDTSLGEINELIILSKNIFKHCYNSITSTELIDSELLGSVSKLLESIHINISEFLNLYKERQRYFDKLKIMYLQQEQKKELMKLKHKYDLELLEKRNVQQVEDNPDVISYSQEDIIKMMNG